MLKLAPHLAFDKGAEDAVAFYVSVFKNSEVIKTTLYAEGQPGAAGSVSAVIFRILGQEMVAVNGGPDFKFSEGISLYVNCDTQEEIDELWESLSAGGRTQECGWLTDRYGVP